MSIRIQKKRAYKRYNVPVIAHFADRSVRFNTILEAEKITGISYNLIFEACIGKIHKARNVYWEFEKGNHYIKYKAHYIRVLQRILDQEIKQHQR
jgi:hypothetical protein